MIPYSPSNANHFIQIAWTNRSRLNADSPSLDLTAQIRAATGPSGYGTYKAYG
jgi:hypothetical protein